MVPVGSYWVNSQEFQACPDGTKNFQLGGKDLSSCEGNSK